MKKKSILNYALTCASSIKNSSYDMYPAQLEDLYDEIQALAASLKIVKDFNIHGDFETAMRKVRDTFKEG